MTSIYFPADAEKLIPGTIFYECEMGMNIEARVLEAPISSSEGFEGRTHWKWKAENTQNGEVIDYGLTEGFAHYGPRLYWQPEYVTIINGEAVVRLVGQS